MSMVRPTSRILLSALLLTGLTGLSGCGDDDTKATPGPTTSASAASSSPAPTPTTAAPTTTTPTAAPTTESTARGTAAPTSPGGARPGAATLPLVVTRSGGFAGVDERAVVGPDGDVQITRDGVRTTRTLSRADLASLRSLLAAPALAREAASAPTSAACADGFRYEFAGPSLTAVVTDCGDARPPTIGKVLAIVGPLLNG